MKKKFLLLPLSLLFLASCNNSPINIPKSPFNDSYQRIGMKSEYNYSLSGVTLDEYNSIKTGVTSDDNSISTYTLQEEFRDLEYAYFGKESSSVSRCRLTSKHDTEQRFSNRVTTGVITSNEQIQTANSSIYKTNTTTEDYKYDTQYKTPTNYSKEYSTVTKTIDSEGTHITTPSSPVNYETAGENATFGLKPYTNHISQHFKDPDLIQLMGTSCVVGKYNTNNYLIKEGFSKFGIHMTKSGRQYVTSRNYFYEGLIVNESGTCKLTDFRFYQEQLILSEAWDGGSIPILYLDKPELINFTETKYKINYDNRVNFTGHIPGVD